MTSPKTLPLFTFLQEWLSKQIFCPTLASKLGFSTLCLNQNMTLIQVLKPKVLPMFGVTKILKEENINLQGFSTTEARDYGILRLVVSDVDKAVTALRNAGYTTHLADVICVEVEDRPGGLNRILDILNRAGINVEYMYAFVQHTGKNAVMIFRIDPIDEAIKLLQKNNVTVIEGSKVYTM